MSDSLSPGRTFLERVTFAALTLACACLTSGCLTPRIVALATGTKSAGYEARTITSVTRAAQRDSGALLVCVETLSSRDERDQVHLEVPLQRLASLRERRSLDFGRDGGFDSQAAADTAALRYVFFMNQLRPGCPETASQVPIQEPGAADGAAEARLYTAPAEKGVTLRYHSPDPLWGAVRDVELAPVLVGEAPRGQGRPAYWLLVPFTAFWDTFILFPVQSFLNAIF